VADCRSPIRSAQDWYANGLRISGSTPGRDVRGDGGDSGHPYFIGCQFHPEFKSKPLEPHPLFKAFVGASYAPRQKKKERKNAAEVEMFFAAGENGTKVITAETQKSAEKNRSFTSLRMTKSCRIFLSVLGRLCGKRL